MNRENGIENIIPQLISHPFHLHKTGANKLYATEIITLLPIEPTEMYTVPI